jgi:hypothetical protein
MNLFTSFGIRASGSEILLLAPTITFVSKTADSITFTLRNNGPITANVYYQQGVNPPTANFISLNSGQTSSNLTISGLNPSTSYTIFAQAQATGVTTSSVVSITQTTLTYSLARGGVTQLSQARATPAAGTIGNNYAIFAGGSNVSGQPTSTVDYYTPSLFRSTASSLSELKTSPGGTSIANFALIGGGSNNTAPLRKTSVDVYNINLSRSSATALAQARTGPKGGTGAGYALFVGGYDGNNESTYVDTYNSSLTKNTLIIQGSRNRVGIGGTPSFFLFAGGTTTPTFGQTNLVNAYNTSLTISTPTVLSVARREVVGASIENFILFAGGLVGSTRQTVVDVYNQALTRSTATALPTANSFGLGVSSKGFAFFTSGNNDNGNQKVVAYDRNLTRTLPSDLAGETNDRAHLGTTVGDYILVGPGSYVSTQVDHYTLTSV